MKIYLHQCFIVQAILSVVNHHMLKHTLIHFFFHEHTSELQGFHVEHSHLLNLIQNSGAGSESVVMGGKNLP